VNISERAGESPELAQAYGIMVNLAGNFRMKRATEWFYKRAIQIARDSEDDVALANVLLITGIYHTGAGSFDVAQKDLSQGAEIFRQLGDAVNVGYCTVTLALTYFLIGEVPKAYELLQGLHESGDTRAPVIDILVTSTQAQINMVRGYIGEAYRQIKHVLAELEHIQADPQLALNPLAFSAEIHWHRGEYYEAYLAANLCGEAAELAQANADLGYVAFAYIAEVYFNLAQLGDEQLVAERSVLLEKGERWTKAMQNFTPPTGVPSAKRCEGELLWLQGKQKKAIRAWQESVEIAQKFNMPLSAGKTQLTWGHYLPEFSAERSAHIQVAINLFESIDANTYLQVAHNVLDTG
jgi:tetratricopeptide (TPR) repeat protein